MGGFLQHFGMVPLKLGGPDLGGGGGSFYVG